MSACPKCGGTEIRTVYHKPGCGDPTCQCATCTYGSHAKRHDEHLHLNCQTCHFDWTTDVLTVVPGEPSDGTDTETGT